MAPLPRCDEINDAVERARRYRLCPHRVWAIAKSFDEEGQKLPDLIPRTEDAGKVKPHDDGGDERHDHCTFDFCERSRIDYTYVPQRHECPRGTCRDFQSFSPEILKNAIEAGRFTAWKLNGGAMVTHPESFMAISHVWADGTGTGTDTRPEGKVNKCLYNFFRRIAQDFKCTGIWWDTICIPREKEAKMKAINNMHNNYANARVTLVHDCYLREWEWKDAKSACFAIIMSPWFTRGWTALELAQSRRVKVMFKSKYPQGYVIKDLDYILDEVSQTHNHPAADAIRELRRSSVTMTHVNDLLFVLGPRVTSKPKDMVNIAALLSGIKVPHHHQSTEQEVYQMILRKFGKVAQSQLFHSSATMSGGFSWCPAHLMKMSIAPRQTREFLEIRENGNVVGHWIVLEVPEYNHRQEEAEDYLQDYDWRTVHLLAKVKIELRLLKERPKHLLLVENNAQKLERALLVKPFKKEGETAELHCHLVGPVYFRQPKIMENPFKMRVTIGDMKDGRDIGLLNAWEYAHNVKKNNHLHRHKQTMDPDISGSNVSQELLSQNATKPDAKDSEGRTVLLLAAMNGDEKMVEKLLTQCEANPDIPDDYSWTALHYAAWKGHAKVINKLLKKAADPNIQDNLGQLPLHLAAERIDWPKQGDWEVIKELWSKTEPARRLKKCTIDGQTALHRAAWGSFAAVKVIVGCLFGQDLLNDDAVYATDDDGKTALDVAAENGNWESVEFLGLLPWKDDIRKRALDLAASNGPCDIASRIRSHWEKFG